MQGCTIFAILVQCSVLCWIVAAQSRRHSPRFSPVSNFNIFRFASGRWYEQKRGARPTCTCLSIDYTPLPDNKLSTSIRANCEIYGRKVWNSTASLRSLGKLSDSWSSNFTYIVDTDYDSYAVFWARKPHGSTSMVLISALSRKKFPSKTVLVKIQEAISRYFWTSDQVYPVDQDNC